MSEVRMAAIDVDGTLIDDDDRMPPENAGAVRRAMAAGVRIVLATGRAYEGVRYIIKELGLTDPLVLLGGSIVMTASGRVMKSYAMPSAHVKAVYEFCRQRDLSVRAQGPYGMYLLFRNPEHPDVALIQRRLREWAPYDYAVIYDYGRLPVRGINKVTILFDTVADMHRLRLEICSSLQGVSYAQAYRNWIEVTSLGISKLKGIKYVARILGVKRRNIVAIGDNENDLELVKWAGLGIYADTAPAVLKEHARMIVPAGEPAVAWGLSRLVSV
ncbi:MAG: HAD family hydrolase [Firmicutes bacterium]|nr:HAD family hydrolase [Bacillota bacterium]